MYSIDIKLEFVQFAKEKMMQLNWIKQKFVNSILCWTCFILCDLENILLHSFSSSYLDSILLKCLPIVACGLLINLLMSIPCYDFFQYLSITFYQPEKKSFMLSKHSIFLCLFIIAYRMRPVSGSTTRLIWFCRWSYSALVSGHFARFMRSARKQLYENVIPRHTSKNYQLTAHNSHRCRVIFP